MDTVEQLNGTYLYALRTNLTASELLFMIFCEKTIEQFGLGWLILVLSQPSFQEETHLHKMKICRCNQRDISCFPSRESRIQKS